MRRTGVLKFWNERNGFGIVVSERNGIYQRFYLRESGIVTCSTAVPEAGMEVAFDAHPVSQEGYLPLAVNADIFRPAKAEAVQP